MKNLHKPTVASIARDMQFLLRENADLKRQVFELRLKMKDTAIRDIVREQCQLEVDRQKKLMSDVNGLMELLLEKGTVTKSELSEACR